MSTGPRARTCPPKPVAPSPHDCPHDLRDLPPAERRVGRGRRRRVRGRPGPGAHRRRQRRLPRPRSVLRQHVPHAGNQEPAGQRVPAAVGGRGRRGCDLSPGHVLRGRQDARAHRAGPRRSGPRRRTGLGRLRGPGHRPQRACPRGGVRRRERGPRQRPRIGGRPARPHPLGRDRLRPGRPHRVRAGSGERRALRCTRGRHPAGTLRRPACLGAAGRAVRLPAQGAGLGRRPGPADGVPHVALQGGREHAQCGARVHAGGGQGRPGHRRLRRREQLHRRPNAGGREGVRPQGHPPQPDGAGRNGSRPPPTPLRGHRREPGRRGRVRVCSRVEGQRRIPGAVRRPPRDPAAARRRLPLPPRGPGDPHRQDRHAGDLPARAGNAAAAGPHDPPPLGDPARRRHRDPRPPRRSGSGVHPTRDRHAPRPVELRACHRRRRVQRQAQRPRQAQRVQRQA